MENKVAVMYKSYKALFLSFPATLSMVWRYRLEGKL